MHKPLVIIDGAYFIYYNLFSAWTTYSGKNNISISDSTFDPTSDIDFVNAYAARLHSRLKFIKNAILPKYLTSEEIHVSNMIFTQECSHAKNWRTEIFPSYKIARRQGPPPDFNIRDVQNYGLNHILKDEKFVSEFKLIFVQADNAEGDDIVATLIKHSKSDNNVLIASDRDFLQLHDKVNIIGLDNKVITIESFCDGENLSSEDLILFKMLLGDGADSIEQVLPGKGVKRCLALLKDRTKLKALIESTEGAAERLKLNYTLMNFKNIPTHIEKQVLLAYFNSLKAYKQNDMDAL